VTAGEHDQNWSMIDGARGRGGDDGRIPILYLAPWIDFGGSDKGTIDWFRWLDRDRFAPSLITTQPSDNRRLREIEPYAEEVWALPDHFAGNYFARFIFDFIWTRGVRVLHVMNSRLGYELLPDLAALPSPPKVVVQLHVEEADRSGYVRYVARRFGNLVDGFSVTSQHLARAIGDYELPLSKIHVIPTGVDAEHEFNPERVQPLDDTEDGAFRILFAGRLADQKDPLLMVEVVRRIAERHRDVRVAVVGDGPLEDAVHTRLHECGLERVVAMHPPTNELARWLRSSDLMLMTSVFEGVPYVVYEALAMGVPVIAPALPGNVELLGEGGGILVADRGDAEAYVRAISTLIADPDRRRGMAVAGRQRMLTSFSLRSMAVGHEELYDRLLAGAPDERAAVAPAPGSPPRLSFPNRPVSGTPPVSIVTPCYNHGRYLDGFLAALDAQGYPELERIIIDDGSTDPETVAALAQIEHDGRARVLRQERNQGPSVARNRGIIAATGRYILPVDADNLLLPGAVGSLVDQLQAAGERVGFIYPGFQYIGTRDYRFDPPAYNLFTLLHGNYADTCSLLDREIFEAGLGFAEDIVLGHEDWDLVLALGARGVVGEPSREPVMLYRKQGFTRSDLVEYLPQPFWREVVRRHPELYGTEDDSGSWGRFRGPPLAIKTEFNPALSLILTEPVDFESERGAALLLGLQNQSCGDFELIAECPRAPAGAAPVVRRLPPGLCATDGGRFQEGLDVSRGRFLLLSDSPDVLFADPTSVERLLRTLDADQDLDAVALADLGSDGGYRFHPIAEVRAGTDAHTVLWHRALHDRLSPDLSLQDGSVAGDLAELMNHSGARMQWRHLSGGRGSHEPARQLTVVTLERSTSGGNQVANAEERRVRLDAGPVVPAAPAESVPRWGGLPTWMPPETLCLVRHRAIGGERRIITNDRRPPVGYQIEFDLGAIQHFAPPGTHRLVCRGGRFLTVPRGTERVSGDDVLGYLEQVPLPLFVGVTRVLLPDGCQTLVLDSERDPLREAVGVGEFLGFVETFPNGPVRAPGASAVAYRTLVRYLDPAARRHRYDAIGSADELDRSISLSAELGRLASRPRSDRVSLWIDAGGRLGTDEHTPFAATPSVIDALKWAGAPARWRGFGYRAARPRAVARRTLEAAQATVSQLDRNASAAGDRRLLGYLHRESGPDRTELFAAAHPVISDQFVTLSALQATDLGYVQLRSLGFTESEAPLADATGEVLAIPWASRFGLGARVG
jgi:glycosyltransferase involved in cell wall biosynthesis